MRRAIFAACLSAGILAGTAGSAGAATLSPASADFGDVPQGTTSASMSFTLSVGADPVFGTSPFVVATKGDFKISSNCPPALTPGNPECTILAQFTPGPTDVGSSTATLYGSSTSQVPSASLRGNATKDQDGGKKCKKKKKGKKGAVAAKKKKCKKGKK